MRPRSTATYRVKKSMFSKFSDFSYSNYTTLKTKCKILFSRCSSIYSISTSGSDKLKAKVRFDLGNRMVMLMISAAPIEVIKKPGK